MAMRRRLILTSTMLLAGCAVWLGYLCEEIRGQSTTDEARQADLILVPGVAVDVQGYNLNRIPIQRKIAKRTVVSHHGRFNTNDGDAKHIERFCE